MKKIALSLLYFLLCGTARVEPQCSSWEAGMGALLWSPYLTTFPNEFTTKPIPRIRTGYQWGLRLYVGYVRNPDFVRLRWDHLATLNGVTSSLVGHEISFAPILIFHLSKVRRQLDTFYDRLNLRLGHHFCEDCRYRFYLFGGFAYLSLKQKLSMKLTGEEGILLFNEFCSFRGGSIEVGVGGALALGCHLTLVVEGGGIGAIGDRRERVFARTLAPIGLEPLTLRDYFGVVCVPGGQLKCVLHYCQKIACIQLIAELGIDYLYYAHPLSRRALGVVPAPANFVNQDIAIFGPSVSLALRF